MASILDGDTPLMLSHTVCLVFLVCFNLLASTPHFGILGLTVEKDVLNLKL